jgi:catechol 2,3-dioxygenase-like lactoylglutathione lyase family enzyme
MLDGVEVVAFVPSSDLDRSLDFYGRTLGLELIARDEFGCEFPGIRVSLVDEPARAPYTVLSWRVEDVETSLRELADRGVVFQSFAGMDQDELGIWTAPSGARIAWFKDPDENTLAIAQVR